MADNADDILDDLFHGCALAAYLDQAAEQQGWPRFRGHPHPEAYDYYEAAAASKHRRPANSGYRVTVTGSGKSGFR